ncbi:unnamed protein product, partial [Prorocentrum cordatum]
MPDLILASSYITQAHPMRPHPAEVDAGGLAATTITVEDASGDGDGCDDGVDGLFQRSTQFLRVRGGLRRSRAGLCLVEAPAHTSIGAETIFAWVERAFEGGVFTDGGERASQGGPIRNGPAREVPSVELGAHPPGLRGPQLAVTELARWVCAPAGSARSARPAAPCPGHDSAITELGRSPRRQIIHLSNKIMGTRLHICSTCGADSESGNLRKLKDERTLGFTSNGAKCSWYRLSKGQHPDLKKGPAKRLVRCLQRLAMHPVARRTAASTGPQGHYFQSSVPLLLMSIGEQFTTSISVLSMLLPVINRTDGLALRGLLAPPLRRQRRDGRPPTAGCPAGGALISSVYLRALGRAMEPLRAK